MSKVAKKTTFSEVAAAAALRQLTAAREFQPPGRVTRRMLGFAAAAVFSVGFDEIAGPRRVETLCRPRFAIALIGRERLRQSYPTIGRLLNRDHSTIMHAYQEGQRRLAADPAFAAACAAIEELLWPRESAVGSRQSAVEADASAAPILPTADCLLPTAAE